MTILLMTKRIQIFFALLGLLILFAGCKKDEEWGPCDNTPRYVPLNPVLAAYVFGDSSQWIYQRSIDSIADTVTLRSAERMIYAWESVGGTGNMTHGCPRTYYEEEQFTLHYESSLTGSYSDAISRDQINRIGSPRGIIYWIGQVGQIRQDFYIEAVRDTMTIGTNRFNNITQALTPVAMDGEWGTLRLYYSPGFGIVRKEILRGDSIYDTYDLVDWQIRPY